MDEAKDLLNEMPLERAIELAANTRFTFDDDIEEAYWTEIYVILKSEKKRRDELAIKTRKAM